MISKRDILDRVQEWGLRAEIVEKDYVLGWILAAIAADPVLGPTWIFKGGTCLKKCYFETYRFSEDLDFTLRPDAPYSEAEIIRRLRAVAERAEEMSGIAFPIAAVAVRGTPKGGFEAKLEYRGPLAMPTRPKITFDLTKDELLAGPFEERSILHSYPDALPEQARPISYSLEELQAEKLRALVERTRPRDLYDLVHLLERRGEHVDLIRTAEIFDEKCRATYRTRVEVGENHLASGPCSLGRAPRRTNQVRGRRRPGRGVGVRRPSPARRAVLTAEGRDRQPPPVRS